jgi:putative endonuclease
MEDKKGFIYILKSLKNSRYYIGSTINVDVRFKQHNQGNVKATKNIRPLEIVFYQSYCNIETARKMEMKLKSFKRKDFIEKIIKDGYIKITPM